MINGKDIYEVSAALVPLYVAMALGYASIRYWKIFTQDQCSGINRFVSVFAIPLLSFHFISSNNPYAMNYGFLVADSLQKVVILVALFLWNALFRCGSLDWVITFFALSCLPNTLVMGIPLLKAMYGESSAGLMVQVVVLQSVVWYTLLLFLFEFRGAKLLLTKQLSETTGCISSMKVDSDVVSLNGQEAVQAEVTKVEEDGSVSVMLRKCHSSASTASSLPSDVFSTTPKAHHYTNTFQPPTSVVHESIEMGEGIGTPTSGYLSSSDQKKMEMEELEDKKKRQGMPSATVMTSLILLMVWRKLIRNPNTYASVLGVLWSLISFRWNIQMPSIVRGSYTILSNTGLGMAMFSLGLFMALQPKIIACGKSLAAFAMAIRFIAGPAVIAATAMAVGVRGVLLQLTIVQAALPQGIVPFVFAKEYNLHADILSTSVIFGMLVSLPVTLVYYVLLGL